MAEDDMAFDFEQALEPEPQEPVREEPPDLPAEVIGQQPGNFKKNYRQTVCTYWLRGLCMKGDECGFLHQFDPSRMPVCRNLLKFGECKDLDCPFKHSMDEVKECNMYKLGFCIYGPQCRYKHLRVPGPPPPPDTVEACKPKEHRNLNVVVNSVNPGVLLFDRAPRGRGERERRPQLGYGERGGPEAALALPAPGSGADGRWQPQHQQQQAEQQQQQRPSQPYGRQQYMGHQQQPQQQRQQPHGQPRPPMPLRGFPQGLQAHSAFMAPPSGGPAAPAYANPYPSYV